MSSGSSELQERIQARLPDGQNHGNVRFDAEPGKALSVWVEVEKDEWRQSFVDPYTGQEDIHHRLAEEAAQARAFPSGARDSAR